MMNVYDFVPAYVENNLAGFKKFQWYKNSHKNSDTGAYRFCFDPKNNVTVLLNIIDNNVHSTMYGRVYSQMDFAPKNKTKDVVKNYRHTRIALEDTLEKKWSAGHLAEDYMHFALKNQIKIGLLKNSSPAILNCFKTLQYLSPEYQNYITQVIAVSNHFNEPNLEQIVQNLPIEVIEGMM